MSNDFEDLERRLRASLRSHAAQAPSADPVADRVLDRVAAGPNVVPLRRTWRTWTTPLLAAAAVAAVVAAVFGTSHLHNSAEPAGPSVTQQPTYATSSIGKPRPVVLPSVSSVAPTPVSTRSAPVPPVSSPTNALSPVPADSTTSTGRPTSTGNTTSMGNTSTGNSTFAGAGKLVNFRAVDATFIGTDQGWALGTAHCLRGPGTCPAMEYTTDGGTTWQSMTQPAGANVPINGVCSQAPCIDHVRFASAEIGYAFGPTALYMTTDGGAVWSRQPDGGALALEAFNGNVIRLLRTNGRVAVQVAGEGSSAWTTEPLPGPAVSAGAGQLVRTGSDAYLLLSTPGGTAILFGSHDLGITWTRLGEPCPQPVTLAANAGAVSVVCRPSSGPAYVTVSTNGGATFQPTTGRLPNGIRLLAGDPATVLLASGSGTYTSTDAGTTWRLVKQVGFRSVEFAGFESPSVGKLITDDGQIIWLTTDAGHSWTPVAFTH